MLNSNGGSLKIVIGQGSPGKNMVELLPLLAVLFTNCNDKKLMINLKVDKVSIFHFMFHYGPCASRV